MELKYIQKAIIPGKKLKRNIPKPMGKGEIRQLGTHI
jgi:hypothetical protein